MLKKLSKRCDRTVLLAIVLLPIIHYGVIQVAQSLSFDENSVVVIWPSIGIYLASVLIFGYRVWPSILLSELIVNPILYGNIPVSISLSFIDLVDPLLTAFLIKQFVRQKGFLDRTSGVFKFIGCLMISPTLTSTLGVSVLCLAGFAEWQSFGSAWWAWWISLVIGMAVITPGILSWVPRFLRSSHRYSTWWIESLIILFLVGVINQIAFNLGYPVEYMLLPLLVWAAIRLEKRLVTLGIIGISAFAIWGTVHGTGSFVRSSVGESLVLLQSFIGVITLTILVLSASTAENITAEQHLQKNNDLLEQRVEERTAELQATLQKLQRAQAIMVQNEKMSSLGQLVAGVAHEINNPVNFIHGNLSHADYYLQEIFELIDLYQGNCSNLSASVQAEIDEIELDFIREDFFKLLQSMKVGTQRIREIVLSLRNFSRLDEAEFKAVDIHEGIDSTLMILQNRIKAKAGSLSIQVVKKYANLPLVQCYAGQLNQVFMNLLTNAVDALEDDIRQGKLDQDNPPTIQVWTRALEDNRVAVHILDNGSGISPQALPKIFDPFFTTKTIGKGTGLGLYISHQAITEKHCGTLTCNSSSEGTEFIIEIPINQLDKTSFRQSEKVLSV